MKEKILEKINEQLANLLKDNPLKDFEKNIKAIVLTIFSKLDLVTREEFEVQKKVLLATREKLDELEKQLQDLQK